MASDDDDPRAPYTVYEGNECKGTYPTRAEARLSAPLDSLGRTRERPHKAGKP